MNVSNLLGYWDDRAYSVQSVTWAGRYALIKTGINGQVGATETGFDSAAVTGSVLIDGDLAALSTGTDSFAGTGTVPNLGNMAAVEVGNGSAAIVAVIANAANLVVTESPPDAFAGSGVVYTKGDLVAVESPDIAALTGTVLIKGNVAAVELPDASGIGGQVLVQGGFALTENADTAQLVGALDPPILITGAQALLLRKLHALHGLAPEPLVVGPAYRRTGDIEQTVTDASGTVTVETTAGNDTFSGSPGLMIEELAALHGLTTPVAVTPTTRTSGTISQTFTTVGGVVTVARQ